MQSNLAEGAVLRPDDATGPTLQVGILGPLDVYAGASPVRIGRGIERRLLSVLAAHAGEVVPDGMLADVLYGDHADASARLRTAMWRLRRSLGAHRDVIQRAAFGHGLDTSACTIDATTFERWLTEGRGRAGSGDHAGALERFDAALDLWRGEALADWADDPRSRPTRVRLEELRWGAVEERAASLAAVGHLGRARAELEALVERNPTREHAWALLIETLSLGSDVRQAWKAFDRARAGLAEAGLEPGMELRRVADRLDVGDWPSRSVPGAGQPSIDAVLEVSMSVRLVGRHAELDGLVATVEASRRGSARAILLEGDAGIGKTRLAAELAVRAGHAGPVWYALCDPYLNLPYRPLIDLARHLLADRPAAERRDLLAGPLGRLASSQEPALRADDLDAARSRYQLFEAVADLLTTSSGGGALLIIDDAHQAPVAVLHLVRHLLVSRPAAPITILLAYQPGALATPERLHALAELRRLGSCQVVALPGLDTTAVGELIEEVIRSPQPASVVREVHSLTGGNPLHVRSLAEGGDLTDGGGSIAGDRVEEVVAGLVQGLDHDSRLVLEVAAVIGRTFERRLLTAMALATDLAMSHEMIDRVLVTARRAGLLAADQAHDGRHAFGHELVQRTLYRGIGAERRAALHLAAGRALERMRLDERGGDDTIAHHFERARPACSASDAAQRLRRAGQEAAHQMDFARAVDFHRAALAMLAEEEEGNGREAAEIGLEIGQAQCDHGDAEAGRASFVSVAERARARGLHDIFAAAAVRHATTLGLGSAPGDNAAAAALLEAACSRADDLTPALYGRVVALRNEMDPRSAPARTRRLVERARTSGDWRRAAALLEHLWWYCVGEARLEVAEELVAAGETGGDPRAEALGRIRRWTTLIHLGRAGFADPEAERIADLVDTVHDAELQWTWTYWRATVATMVGDLDAAERLIAQTLRIPGLTTSASSPLISRTKVLSFHQVQADQLAVLRGQPADFRARLSVPPTWGWRRLDVRPLGVWPLLAAGRIPEAHALLDPLVTEFPWSEQPNLDWLISLALLAQGCAASGYQRGAARAHAALDPHRGLFLVQGANSLGPVDHYAGLVEKALGDLDAAIDSQRAAVAHSRRAHASVYEVICGAQLARLLHRRGGPGDDLDSEQAAVTAAALADRCGMPRRKRPEAPQGVRIAAPAG